MAMAQHTFEATEATHITLSRGQHVRIIEERDGGWSYGEAETSERGTFPTSYVQPDCLGGESFEVPLAKLSRSDSFTTVASRRALLPDIAVAQSIGQGLRVHLAKVLTRLPDVSPWDSVSCVSGAHEEPELRQLGDTAGSGLGLTSDEVANLLGSIELNNAGLLQKWARTESITGGDLQQLLFLERAEADAILSHAGLSSALHRRRLLSQVQGWSQCGVPSRLIETSPPPDPVQTMPLAPIPRPPSPLARSTREGVHSLQGTRATGSGVSLGGGDAAVAALVALVATGAVAQSSACGVCPPPPPLPSGLGAAEGAPQSPLPTATRGVQGAAAGTPQQQTQQVEQQQPHVRSVQHLISHWKRLGEQFVVWQRAIPSPPVFLNASSFICARATMESANNGK